MVSHLQRKTQIKGVWEEGAEENMWAQVRSVEKTV
jgi:hypothetical protein